VSDVQQYGKIALKLPTYWAQIVVSKTTNKQQKFLTFARVFQYFASHQCVLWSQLVGNTILCSDQGEISMIVPWHSVTDRDRNLATCISK